MHPRAVPRGAALALWLCVCCSACTCTAMLAFAPLEGIGMFTTPCNIATLSRPPNGLPKVTGVRLAARLYGSIVRMQENGRGSGEDTQPPPVKSGSKTRRLLAALGLRDMSEAEIAAVSARKEREGAQKNLNRARKYADRAQKDAEKARDKAQRKVEGARRQAEAKKREDESKEAQQEVKLLEDTLAAAEDNERVTLKALGADDAARVLGPSHDGDPQTVMPPEVAAQSEPEKTHADNCEEVLTASGASSPALTQDATAAPPRLDSDLAGAPRGSRAGAEPSAPRSNASTGALTGAVPARTREAKMDAAQGRTSRETLLRAAASGMAGLLVAGGTTSFLRGFFGVFENKKALARSSDADLDARVEKLAARKTAVASAPQKAPELREAAPKDAVAKEQAAKAKTNPVTAREQPGAQVATKRLTSEESGPQVAAGGAAERPSSDEQEDGVDLGDVLDLAGQVGGGLVKGAQTAGKVAQAAGKTAVVVGGAAVKTAEMVVDVTAKVAEVLPQMQQGVQDGARAIAPVVEGVGREAAPIVTKVLDQSAPVVAKAAEPIRAYIEANALPAVETAVSPLRQQLQESSAQLAGIAASAQGQAAASVDTASDTVEASLRSGAGAVLRPTLQAAGQAATSLANARDAAAPMLQQASAVTAPAMPIVQTAAVLFFKGLQATAVAAFKIATGQGNEVGQQAADALWGMGGTAWSLAGRAAVEGAGATGRAAASALDALARDPAVQDMARSVADLPQSTARVLDETRVSAGELARQSAEQARDAMTSGAPTLDATGGAGIALPDTPADLTTLAAPPATTPSPSQ